MNLCLEYFFIPKYRIKQNKTNHLTETVIFAIDNSTNILQSMGCLIVELFQGRRIKKEAYENMYYMQSLSLQHDRYLCDNTYLSNPKKTYSLRRPLI